MSDSLGELQGNVQSQASNDSTLKQNTAMYNGRLGDGVIGKLSVVLLRINVTVGSAACLVAPASPLLATVIIAAALVLDIVIVNRLISFAERHPNTAVMNAPEIIIYKQQQKMDVLEPPVVQPITYLEL